MESSLAQVLSILTEIRAVAGMGQTHHIKKTSSNSNFFSRSEPNNDQMQESFHLSSFGDQVCMDTKAAQILSVLAATLMKGKAKNNLNKERFSYIQTS